MTPKQEAALRQAVDAWFRPGGINYVDFKPYMDALREALTEQQSGIKQVIELYDSPEQPAQQDYWQEEARRYAQNAEFWRGKYEAATAQQQKPDGRVISVNWEYATVQWLHQTSNIGEGDPKNSRSWPIGGEDVYLSPQPSKPWVGLTDEEVDECYYWKGRQWTTDELVRHVEAKLREKNNG